MKTNSLKGNKSLSKGNNIFEKIARRSINRIAKLSGYKKRNRGKIDVRSLIIGFMMMVSKKMNTYEALASELSVLVGKSLTRQAVESRMNRETSVMMRMVLEEKLTESINQTKLKDNEAIMSKFRSVNIEDSTILHLPDELSKEFPEMYQEEKRNRKPRYMLCTILQIIVFHF